VSDEPDPERLLAEALRAQAVRAPMAEPVTPPVPPVVAPPAAEPDGNPVLKLLSGTDEHGLLSGSAPDTLDLPVGPVHRNAPPPRSPARRPDRPAPLSVWWIVLLAVLLGLAAGAVVGLVSVL
jgi:hypothetical protein